jgi:CRISPR/Cas system-associated exonuclease Cas4 (RecB family)
MKINEITIASYFVCYKKLCVFQSFRIHKSMNVNNTIEKLQKIAKDKETWKSEHKWR